MRKTSPEDSRGFSLIEVMMAMLILTVGLLGLLQSIQIAYVHNTRKSLRDEAVQLAEDTMNSIRSLPFDNITANYCTLLTRDVGGRASTYKLSKAVEPVGGDGRNDTKKLTVAVVWSFKSISSEHMIYSVKSK